MNKLYKLEGRYVHQSNKTLTQTLSQVLGYNVEDNSGLRTSQYNQHHLAGTSRCTNTAGSNDSFLQGKPGQGVYRGDGLLDEHVLRCSLGELNMQLLKSTLRIVFPGQINLQSPPITVICKLYLQEGVLRGKARTRKLPVCSSAFPSTPAPLVARSALLSATVHLHGGSTKKKSLPQFIFCEFRLVCAYVHAYFKNEAHSNSTLIKNP